MNTFSDNVWFCIHRRDGVKQEQPNETDSGQRNSNGLQYTKSTPPNFENNQPHSIQMKFMLWFLEKRTSDLPFIGKIEESVSVDVDKRKGDTHNIFSWNTVFVAVLSFFPKCSQIYNSEPHTVISWILYKRYSSRSDSSVDVLLHILCFDNF